MRFVLRLAAAALVMCATAQAAEERIGILVMAHGGDNRWNGTVRKTVRQAKLDAPTEVALGMGMHPGEIRELREAVNRLERKGVARIAVVPLLVSSHSEVFRQYEYLLGLRPQAEWPEAGPPLRLEVPVVMGPALDGSAQVAQILLERAKDLSRRPAEETVVLIAHGPVSDEDNRRWLTAMQQLAASVQQQGGFRAVLSATMRDDAPKAVKEQAERQIREVVARAGEGGRALVVPLLLAPGGVEKKIPKILTGLAYVYNGETLLPHPKVVEWLRQQVAQPTRL